MTDKIKETFAQTLDRVMLSMAGDNGKVISAIKDNSITVEHLAFGFNDFSEEYLPDPKFERDEDVFGSDDPAKLREELEMLSWQLTNAVIALRFAAAVIVANVDRETLATLVAKYEPLS